MDEKLNDAYNSLQAAHDAGNTADATQIADYIETLKTQFLLLGNLLCLL